MTTNAHTKASIDGMLKDIYSDEGLQSLLPDVAIIQKAAPFKEAEKVGKDFVSSVQLTHEHGFTYGSGLQTLVGASPSVSDDAKVRGSSFVLEAAWSYDAAAAMASSKQAFITGTEHKLKAMMAAAAFRLELQMLRSSLGVADSSQDSVTVVTATKNAIIPILPSSWAPAAFSGCEGAHVSFFTSAAGAASAAVGVDSTANKFLVKSVDTDAKTITVETKDGTEAAALVAEIEAANYEIRFFGANSNEMVSLRSIASNSGSLFGIDGAAYSLWRGNTYAAGGALSLQKIYSAVAKAVGRGLLEDVSVFVSPATFAVLANNEAALRQYVAKTKSADRGVESIEFTGPNGRISVVTHPLQAEGEALIIPMKRVKRIGASDMTLKRPGFGNAEMVFDLPTQTGIGCKLYSEQAVLMAAPAMACVITGITN